MFKLLRLSAATLLGLLMAVTLLVPGVFAQRSDARHTGPQHHRQHVSPYAQPLSAHCGGCGWDDGWGDGWYGYGWGW